MLDWPKNAENKNGPALLSPARRKRDLGAAGQIGDRM
jgi:hypothetical protein